MNCLPDFSQRLVKAINEKNGGPNSERSRRVVAIMPAIILVDELFGADCPENSDKRNSRWSQLEKDFKETGTAACKALLKDIDSARKIIRQNAGKFCKKTDIAKIVSHSVGHNKTF